MIDTRALAQEVQDQLVAAVHRGQEQLRKRHDQVRKSQDQVRKGREVVVDALRMGNERAKAARSTMPELSTLADPAKLRARSQELADQFLASQRQLADRAIARQRHLADQVVASQRHLADQVVARQRQALRSASPVVAQRVAQLTQVFEVLPGMRRLVQPETATRVTVRAEPTPSPADTGSAGLHITRLDVTDTGRVEAEVTAPAQARKPRTPRVSAKSAGAIKTGRPAGPERAARSAKPTDSAKRASTSKAGSGAKAVGTSGAASAKTAGATKTGKATTASKSAAAKRPGSAGRSGTTRSAGQAKARGTKS